MQGDTLQPSYPNNTHKQDWAYYPFVGGRGGGSGVVTGVTRYSFWVDFDPFDVKNLKMLSENISFQIFNDSLLSVPLIPYFIIDQANDITDELVEANLPTDPGQSVSVGPATVNYPPFGYADTGTTIPYAGVPPISGIAGPTGIAAGASVGGSIPTGTTYYYCLTANVGGIETLPSAIVSATTINNNNTIGVTFKPVTGATSYNIYRNTTSSFTSGSLTLSYYFYPGQPPYYLNTVFNTQPINTNFRSDQGKFCLSAFKGNGFGFGNSTMVGQGFVPTQNKFTEFFLGSLFHISSTDPTTYNDINFELWDANHNFVQHLGTLSKGLSLTPTTITPSGLTTDTYCTAICNSISYNTGTDGQLYWSRLDQLCIRFTDSVSLTVGSTYYIIVRTAVQTASAYYALGSNYDNSAISDPLYYYPFAHAITATDGSSTWSSIVDAHGKYITFPFMTVGSIGRYAVTYWWANVGNGASNYWAAVPNANDYSFLHIDYNSRI